MVSAAVQVVVVIGMAAVVSGVAVDRVAFNRCLNSNARPMEYVDAEDVIPGRYITVFQRDATNAQITSFMDDLKAVYALQSEKPDITKEININDKFRAFAAGLSDGMVADIRGCDGGQLPLASTIVDYVIPDAKVSIPTPVEKDPVPVENNIPYNISKSRDECVSSSALSWGQTRTTERDLNLNGKYTYLKSENAAVDAYVLDTGIYLEHNEFEGRAVWGIDVTTNNSPKTDENGHGTHVAGTIAGVNAGICKTARLIAIRVLDGSGSGSMSGVMTGVNYVCTHHSQNSENKCVANMSLGGGKYKALNQAVEAAISCGCQFSLAAGNGSGNACNGSPGSTEDAITVMASDSQDKSAYYTDYGKCADLYAPGSAIKSAWIGGKNFYVTISGTSMAAPHVAGVMAKILGSGSDLGPDDLKSKILEDATQDIVSNIPSDKTPNLLLFKQCSETQ